MKSDEKKLMKKSGRLPGGEYAHAPLRMTHAKCQMDFVPIEALLKITRIMHSIPALNGL